MRFGKGENSKDECRRMNDEKRTLKVASLRIRFWLVGGLRPCAFARAWGIGRKGAYNIQKILAHWSVTYA